MQPGSAGWSASSARSHTWVPEGQVTRIRWQRWEPTACLCSAVFGGALARRSSRGSGGSVRFNGSSAAPTGRASTPTPRRRPRRPARGRPGVHPRGTRGVDPDARRSPLEGQWLGQADHPGLRRRASRALREAACARGGSRVHDRRLRSQVSESSWQVRKVPLRSTSTTSPLLDRKCLRRTAAGERGAVDEPADAPELSGDRGNVSESCSGLVTSATHASVPSSRATVFTACASRSGRPSTPLPRPDPRSRARSPSRLFPTSTWSVLVGPSEIPPSAPSGTSPPRIEVDQAGRGARQRREIRVRH